MKPIDFLSKNHLFTLLILFLINANLFSQSEGNRNVGVTPVEILSQCLTSQSLWQQLPANLRNVNDFYILNHGVNLDLAENLKIQGKPVSLISKGDTNIMANYPYFLFHTFNISENVAFARIYLAYRSEGEEKTATIELSFIKENSNWILKTNS